MKFSEDQRTTETALTKLQETVLFHGTRCYFDICCYLKSKGSNPQALILWDGLRATTSIVAVHAKTQRAVVPHCPLNSHQKPAAVPPHPGTPRCVSPFCTNPCADFHQNFPILLQLQANSAWLHCFEKYILKIAQRCWFVVFMSMNNRITWELVLSQTMLKLRIPTLFFFFFYNSCHETSLSSCEH